MTTERIPRHGSRWSTRANGVLLAFLAIAAFFLFTEHRAHLLGILPLVLLLACPLLHLFLHGGHGSGHGEHGKDEPQDPRRAQP